MKYKKERYLVQKKEVKKITIRNRGRIEEKNGNEK